MGADPTISQFQPPVFFSTVARPFDGGVRLTIRSYPSHPVAGLASASSNNHIQPGSLDGDNVSRVRT